MFDGAGPLAGRDADLAQAGAILDAPGPWMAQIAGPAGIGKSRLLRELATAARERGYLVLDGRAADFDAEPPFGIVRHALDDWIRDRDPGERAALAGDDGPALAPILPGLSAPLGTDATPTHERHRGYAALRRLLETIARQRPLLLVLDDLHWADAASAELLAYLSARPPRAPVRLALGLRPSPLAPALESALARAVREHEAVRLDLDPLSATACAAVLGDAVGPDIARALHRESGGTPFFLLALARAHIRDGRSPGRVGEPSPSVPTDVRVALAGELRALSPDGLRLLRGAAVAGDPCDATVAAYAAGLAPEPVPSLVGELQRSGLVTVDEGSELVFRHPIVRATVVADADGGWIAAAHRRIAAHLEALGADPAARAPHLERSAVPGDAGAVATLRAAGDASARRAPALAARWYGAAAALVPGVPDTADERIGLRVDEAGAAVDAGRLDHGRDALGVALELLPADDPRRSGVEARCAGVEHLLGRHRDAHARLTAARAAVSSESAEAVLLDVELAACAGFETRPVEMLERARAALATAERLDLRPLVAVAAGQLALARYFVGGPLDADLDLAADRFDGLTDAELATRLDLGLWLGWTEAVCERHHRSLTTTDRVLRVSRETARGATVLVTRTAATWSLLRLGRLAEADAMLTEAITAGRLAPHLFLSVSFGQRALLRTAQGRRSDAITDGEASVRLARHADPGLIPGMSGLYSAVPLLEAGRPDGAREVLLAMSGGDPGLRTSRSGHVPAYEVLTRAAIAGRDLAGAESWSARATAAAHGGVLPAEDAHAQRAAAELALARGDAASALERTSAAADRSLAAGLPIEAGRCETLAGRALLALGRRDEALVLLERAADRLTGTGAHGWADGAETDLRRLGRRRPRPAVDTDSGLGVLTERERQIADLVRSGLRNREIAAQLFVSEKTVERALSTTYAKLGLPNRAALSAAVEESRRVPVDH
ncbi:MAG: helix-turn-helix transcriptional regulator [Solirubrobacteraceae bacterium]